MKGICNLNTKSLDSGRKPYKFGKKNTNKNPKLGAEAPLEPGFNTSGPVKSSSLCVCVLYHIPDCIPSTEAIPQILSSVEWRLLV